MLIRGVMKLFLIILFSEENEVPTGSIFRILHIAFEYWRLERALFIAEWLIIILECGAFDFECKRVELVI
jgi:hypothetical protein